MKKFIPVLVGLALTVGALTMNAGPQEKGTKKGTGAPKSPKKGTK